MASSNTILGIAIIALILGAGSFVWNLTVQQGPPAELLADIRELREQISSLQRDLQGVKSDLSSVSNNVGILLRATGFGTLEEAEKVAEEREFLDKLFEEAKKEGVVSIAVAWEQALIDALVNAFQKRYPGISVEVFRGPSSDLVEKIKAEARAGKFTIDVGPSGGVDSSIVLKNAGLVAPWEELPEAKAFPEEMLLGKRFGMAWYPRQITLLGIAYNTELVKPGELTKMEDILDHKWRGKITIQAPYAPGGANLMMAGWEKIFPSREAWLDFLRRLARQDLNFQASAHRAGRITAEGQFAIVVGARSDGVFELKEQGAPIDFLWQAPLVGRLEGSAILKNAPHPNAARLFANWLMSEEAARITGNINGRTNARPGVEARYALEKWVPPQFMKNIYIEPNLEAIPKIEEYMQLFRKIFIEEVGIEEPRLRPGH